MPTSLVIRYYDGAHTALGSWYESRRRVQKIYNGSMYEIGHIGLAKIQCYPHGDIVCGEHMKLLVGCPALKVVQGYCLLCKGNKMNGRHGVCSDFQNS